VGQTAAEAKREVDQTRAHLAQTLEAIQLRARRNLDLRMQLRTNRTLQVTLASLLLAFVAISLIWSSWRSRLSTSERLLRRLRLNKFRDRVREMPGDLSAAGAAVQKRFRRSGGSREVAPPHRESLGRRLIFSTAEAALTALAASLAKRMIDRTRIPHERAHPTAAVSRKA
jgi:hypothetical protein